MRETRPRMETNLSRRLPNTVQQRKKKRTMVFSCPGDVLKTTYKGVERTMVPSKRLSLQNTGKRKPRGVCYQGKGEKGKVMIPAGVKKKILCLTPPSVLWRVRHIGE